MFWEYIYYRGFEKGVAVKQNNPRTDVVAILCDIHSNTRLLNRIMVFKCKKKSNVWM